MTPGQAFEQPLLAIFAGEARTHLARVGAGLDALERPGIPAPAAPLEAVLDVLHTLQGAARAVELHDLEYLCHALAKVFGAARGGVALAPAQFGLVRHAVELAGVLAEQPGGRSRNQALALMGQLDALARELAARAPPPGNRQPHPTPQESGF